MSKSASKSKSNSLPSGTTAENLLNLINVLKKNNRNEESVKALFKMSSTVYNKTKAALRAFGIIENKNLDFTADVGRDIAFSGEDNKKDVMLRIVKRYEPYELVLNSIETSRTETKFTDIDTIKNLWGRASYGSGDRNRNDGATLFMGIIDYIGFGKYFMGRGNNPTRIEWISDITEKINSLNQSSPIVEQKDDANTKVQDTIEARVIDTVPAEEEQEYQDEHEENTPAVIIADERNIKTIGKPTSAVSLPNIMINVDMSDWSDEKIRSFFKCAYGKFEEN